MKALSRAFTAAFGVVILTAALSLPANAQCVTTTASLVNPSLPGSGSLAADVIPAVFSVAASGDAVAYAPPQEEPIVGFWKVKLLSRNNPGVADGTVIDEGYTQWHEDGTEIMNSSRPPATGNFCLGVWEKTGPSTYRLNHFAIAWNADGTLLGPARLQETVTVSRDQKSFSGTFTLDQYDQAGAVQLHRGGRIEGQRITVTTSIDDARLN